MTTKITDELVDAVALSIPPKMQFAHSINYVQVRLILETCNNLCLLDDEAISKFNRFEPKPE